MHTLWHISGRCLRKVRLNCLTSRYILRTRQKTSEGGAPTLLPRSQWTPGRGSTAASWRNLFDLGSSVPQHGHRLYFHSSSRRSDENKEEEIPAAIITENNAEEEEEEDAQAATNDLSPYVPDILCTPSFIIPEDDFQRARDNKDFWSWKLYRHKETNKQPMRHYCHTSEASERIAQLFLNEKVLGFDLEWSPRGKQYTDPGVNAKANCSMLQLASEDRIAIFHLARHTETDPSTILPPTLRTILTNPHILKTGVAIKGDMTRLHRYYACPCPPDSVLELSHLYKTITYASTPELINRRFVSLSELVRKVFGLELSKDENVRGSDWSNRVGMVQVDYAASDAYAGVMLWWEMERRRRGMVPVPEVVGARKALKKRPEKRVVSKRPGVEGEDEREGERGGREA